MAGGGAIANLAAHLEWDLDDFQRGTVSIEKAFKGIIGIAGDMADAVAAAGRRMTLGLTLPIAGIGGLMLKAASDAEELQSAFDYTFGKMSGTMNRWAEESGNAMGRSTQEMQEGALALGGLFQAAAPTEAAAVRLAQQFTELAQDAASFNNTDFDTALGKIRSGLTGEAEPLREFRVFLSEAKVEAKALELGLISSGQKLDEYGKIMARSALIADELSYANGDVERTSDSLANRMRAIKSQFQELAVEIGEYLIPYAQKLAGVVETVVTWFKNLPEGVKRAAVGFGVFLAALGPLSIALSAIAVTLLPMLLVNMGPVMLAISAIINPIGTAVALFGKWIIGVGGLSAALQIILPMFLRIAGPIGIVITLLQLFGDDIVRGLKLFWETVSEAIGPGMQELWARLSGLVDQLGAAFDQLAQSELGQFISEVGEAIGWLIEQFFELASYLVGGFLSNILSAMNAVVEFISGAIDVVTKLLSGDWAGAWDAAVQVVGRAIIRIGNWVSQLFPWLGGMISMLGRLTGAEITTVKTPPAITAPGAANDDEPIGGGGRNYALAQDEKAKKKGRGRTRRGRTGPTPEELAERREEIRLEHELALAREKGDQDAIRALERQRDLKNAIEKYERAGLGAAQAKIAAERDLAEMDQARAVAREEMLSDRRKETEYRVAELNDDFAHLRYLEEERDLAKRINELNREGYDLAAAERIAANEMLAIEKARADQIERRMADQENARQIELARARGDDEASIGRMEEDIRVRDRAEELQRDFQMGQAEALEQAQREAMDRSHAHMQGSFRDAFRQGLQAAMNGDLGGFFENWMRDRSFKALSNVLDRLADSLANLVSGRSSGGGGFLGGLLGLFGGSRGAQGGLPGRSVKSAGGAKPKFANGGRFTIKGFPGIDTNLLSLNGNPIAHVSSGEIMNIERGEPRAAAPTRVEVLPSPYFDVRVDGRIQGAAPGIAAAGGQAGMAQMAFRQSRRLG